MNQTLQFGDTHVDGASLAEVCRRYGVKELSLFGSSVRGEMRPESDIDIMVEIAPEADVGLWQYAGIVRYLEDLFPVPVDVANREGLKSRVRPSAERDAIYAF